MILHHKIVAQLREKWPGFVAFDASYRHEATGFRSALNRISELSSGEIIALLANEQTPGALPTDEFDSTRKCCLKFPQRFNNHQEARTWACETLLEHTTFAVDGSQIRHDPNFNIPVAAVQVAWFENCHTQGGRYSKDLKFEVLGPEELLIEYNGDQVYSEQQVNLHRFELEIETLCQLMEKTSSAREQCLKLPLALFDSSLVISFADRLHGAMRDRHVKAMLKLLRCSEKTGIPLVGYVDMTYARDLTHMITNCSEQSEALRVHDAQLVNDLLSWGDRTPYFICARGGADRNREGVLESFEEYRRKIGFVYLKTNSTTPPARLEIPLWVFERGLLDEVIDLVRAEIIVGNGYPYVIEAADATAVIGSPDRDAFYAIFHRFAREHGVETRISQKATSKLRRR